MTEWYNLSWNEVVEQLNSDANKGLTEEKVEKLQNSYGKNIIEIPKGNNILYIMLLQFKNFWLLYMLLIIGIYFYIGQVNEAISLFGILMLNIIVISFGESEREKEIKELQRLQSSQAMVVRNGATVKIAAEDLVVGDIIILNDGDIVPADIRLIEGDNIKVKEGAVTGEGYTVEKYSTKIEDKELPLTEVRNILFKSSAIIEGSGKGIVIATGTGTEIANIIGLVVENNEEGNMINKKLHSILNSFTVISIIISAFMAFIQLYILKGDIVDGFFSFAWAPIAFIPFSIFILIEIISYFIIKDFNKKGTVIKNLSVVENLSKINMICEDKVGVFSENYAHVKSVYVDDNLIGVEDLNLMELNEEFNTLNRVIHIGMLCNDTKFTNGEYINPKNDITEIGLAKFVRENNIHSLQLEGIENRVLTIPFDKDRRLMSTINRVDNNYRANVRGTVDSLLNRCTHLMKNGVEKEIAEEDIRKIKYADIQMSRMGLYVVGFGYRNYNYEPSINENLESNLVFAGLIGFYNPPLNEISNLIKKGRELNIHPIIFTEENKLTAESFGKKIGILNRVTRVLSAVEMDNMPEEDLNKIIGRMSIFSKLESKHKTKIGKHYKEIGQNLMMSGKRITDLPYLRISKVGMALDGTNIVNKLSDVLVKERTYESLLNIIISSRKIVNSLINIITYSFLCSLTAVIVNIASKLLGLGYVLNFYNILWINVITTIISSIGIALNYKNEEEYNTESIGKNIFNGIILKSIFKAVFIAAVVLGSLYLNEKISFLILNLCLIILSITFNKKHTSKSKLCYIFNAVVQLIYFIILTKPNI
ncbi:cation-transporting P-type ATPase [Clostridium sp. MSJ-11]|uniref:Cation-transporting P-type ATPase n=1 Tax=Clostridium mobile TaxID=2841512 RepID=A0ABS6EEA9_9CLOT|nr:cation-transporting P-type ATPase [Clostridium mobile]MBU5483542.1 cation-transporting P-type ATPase [Clostridium mobile]